MYKQAVHAKLVTAVKEKADQLRQLLNDAQQAVASDTKSSAGDKHETSRAMAQLEQEKIGGQLAEMIKLQENLMRIDPTKEQSIAQLGSLIETSIGWFYLSIGIGAISMDDKTIFCMTPAAPLGQAFSGKRSGDQINWQGKDIQIRSIQ